MPSSFSAVLLVLVNLFPIFGALFLNWDYQYALLLYWAENVVIGIITLVKMIMAKKDPDSKDIEIKVNHKLVKVYKPGNIKPFYILFFIFHYGLFCLVHGLFVLALTAMLTSANAQHPDLAPAAYLGVIALPLLLITISHLFSFFSNYVGKKEYEQSDVATLMGQPYGRIIIVHVVILAGFALMTAFSNKLLPFILLVTLKTIADLWAHLKEHRKFSQK